MILDGLKGGGACRDRTENLFRQTLTAVPDYFLVGEGQLSFRQEKSLFVGDQSCKVDAPADRPLLTSLRGV